MSAPSTDHQAVSTVFGGYLLLAEDDLTPMLDQVSEMLIDQVCMTSEQSRVTGWDLPAVLSDPEVEDAWYRMYHAIRPLLEAALDDDAPGVITSNRGSCSPLLLVDIDPADVERVRELDRHLQLATVDGGAPDRSHADLDDLLDQIAGDYEHELRDRRTGESRDGAYLAAMLHRVLAVLDLSAGDGAQLLRAAVAAAGTDDVNLAGTPAEGAYQELVLQTVRLVGCGSPLKLWAHLGNADGTMPARL